jgi:dockerin type I repeat protein
MKLGIIVAGVAALCAAPLAARAEDPTPASCRVSPITACPAGDLRITVTVRKGHDPLPALVTLDLSTCAGLKLADKLTDDADTSTDGFQLTKRASTDGRALFAFHAGGAASCTRLLVLANGLVIAERTAVASPDQNGDLLVDQADLELMRAKLGTKDATADLDGDGRVTPTDVLLARLHLGHRAEAPRTSRATTWGEIKSGYPH